jgi:hypothetical protein
MRTFIALALLAIAGCSSTCKDRFGQPTLFKGGAYESCNLECCRKAKECHCSVACPCWKRDDHPNDHMTDRWKNESN